MSSSSLLQPVGDMLGVIGANILGDAEFGAQQRGPDFAMTSSAACSCDPNLLRSCRFRRFSWPERWALCRHRHNAHWSGARSRLDREFGKKFGDQAYCVEEIVAELTSAYVTTSLGITHQPREDHAQYIAHYLALMKADKRAIFTAAAKAAQAAEYLAAFSAPATTATQTSPSRDTDA